MPDNTTGTTAPPKPLVGQTPSSPADDADDKPPAGLAPRPQQDNGSDASMFGLILQLILAVFGLGDMPSFGGMGDVLGALTGGGTTKPAPAAPETHVIDGATQEAKTKREAETHAALVTMASLIDFKNPDPSNPIDQRDRVLLAHDLAGNKSIAFYNDKTGEYESLKTDSAEALNALIRNDTKGVIRIDYGVGEEKIRFLQQTTAADRGESPTGFAAAAWKAVDEAGTKDLGRDGNALPPGGKTDVYLGFPGYTGQENALADTTPQAKALEIIAENKLNPQAAESAAFTDKAISIAGRDNVAAVITGVHSMGVSNGRVAEVTAHLENIPTVFVDLEPALDKGQSKALDRALADTNSALYKELQSLGVPETKIAALHEDYDKNTLSVRSEFKDASGAMDTTTVSKVVAGKGLMAGYMDLMQGKGDAGIDNGMQGVKDYVDMTSLHLANASMDAHKLSNLVKALKDANVTMAEAGTAPSPSQPALPKVAAVQQDGPAQPQHG